jgi:hypothetical protein
LAERHSGLEAQAERAPVADRAGEEATGDSAEQDGEVVDTRRDHAVGEEPGSSAESSAQDDSDDGEADGHRRGSLQKMLRILLDDALVQIFHPRSSSAGPAPVLSRLTKTSSTLTYLLMRTGTVR